MGNDDSMIVLDSYVYLDCMGIYPVFGNFENLVNLMGLYPRIYTHEPLYQTLGMNLEDQASPTMHIGYRSNGH